MHGIGKIFDKKYGGLIFSLLAGSAYFIIILDFILKHTQRGGALLGFFFSPAIIAGVALVIIKTIKRLEADEAFTRINLFLYLHLILMLLGIVFLFDIIKG
ncbi:MAG: hypothetical protein IKR46_03090 [Clostridia bacterium]|nr:hypothetical protein [Clostridia bacterium]